MLERIGKIYHKILVVLHLSPLSLAGKCRLTFGIAIILVLALALSIPYIWMKQLTTNACLDAGRASAESLLRRHFQAIQTDGAALAPLDNMGRVLDINNPDMRWIRFTKDLPIENLSGEQRRIIEELKSGEAGIDDIRFIKRNDVLYSDYIQVFKANENCISCHNPQGSASAFNRNEPIGALVVRRPAGDIGKVAVMNLVLLIVAGLISGVGAVITFYIITQRLILSPIRQLRALADNVAEGNLDIRSAIDTRDEYQKLSEAFNHMLDSLQMAQQKLRQANVALDQKIVELSERNIELFKANKLKDEFLANVTHEFRTPLNAILGFADILREKPDVLTKEKTRRYAENIITGGRSLLNMINNLLDLAKTEAGKMKLFIEATALKQLCEATVASFAGLTRKKRIKVRVFIDEKVPELMTDGRKIQQILYNFLSNAVKFTPEHGRIEVKASMFDDKHVRIAVSDTGCGVAEADKKEIFEKFRQADGSLTRETTGSGLGLAICTELAAMLAGAVAMESELGKGSTFWLDIPVTLTLEGKEA